MSKFPLAKHNKVAPGGRTSCMQLLSSGMNVWMSDWEAAVKCFRQKRTIYHLSCWGHAVGPQLCFRVKSSVPDSSVTELELLLLLTSLSILGKVGVLPGRYSCSGPLCWSAAGLGDALHSGSAERKGGSRLIDPSSSTPPWTGGTAGLPAASGSAGSCCVMWKAGRRAERLKQKRGHFIKMFLRE